MLIRADLNWSIPVVYLSSWGRLDNAFDHERWKVLSLDEPSMSQFLIRFSKQTAMKELGSNNITTGSVSWSAASGLVSCGTPQVRALTLPVNFYQYRPPRIVSLIFFILCNY